MDTPFCTVLVANRGEIAVRVMRTLRAMGIRSVGVYSDADQQALHVRTADHSVRIGPAAARHSYLSVDAVIGAALETGAEAIHPGYGFLSENPALARACAEHGIVFIGPPVAAIEAMGDKIAAKATVAAAGVRVVPGSDGAGLDDAGLRAAAIATGFPVLIKPSAGGGGKGMRLVEVEHDLDEAIASARREARGSFGDDTLLVERFVANPRHIEIQVLGDAHGNVVHLGERECSLQRRHQKIIEEAPSAMLTPTTRASMGAQAVEAARACGYVGAGTVEFIVSADRPDEFFFMEMNTRLQVEHPVTELIHRLDLVELQVRVAAGEPLPFAQQDLVATGHAIEARVYAEDPERGFLPTGGRVLRYRQPSGDGVRVDSGIDTGSVIGSDYDPMLAKVIAWGSDRSQALGRLDQALARTAVLGVTTNIGFLRSLLADPDVVAGRIDTGLVERRLDSLTASAQPEVALAALALWRLRPHAAGDAAWGALAGWRHHDRASTTCEIELVGRPGRHSVSVRGVDHGFRVTIDDGPVLPASLVVIGESQWSLTIHGRQHLLDWSVAGGVHHVGLDGSSWAMRVIEHRGGEGGASASGTGAVRSPMPGTVIALSVAMGDAVVAGQTVAVVEAMKMEHALRAGMDGIVSDVHVAIGASVAMDAAIVSITGAASSGEASP